MNFWKTAHNQFCMQENPDFFFVREEFMDKRGMNSEHQLLLLLKYFLLIESLFVPLFRIVKNASASNHRMSMCDIWFSAFYAFINHRPMSRDAKYVSHLFGNIAFD